VVLWLVFSILQQQAMVARMWTPPSPVEGVGGTLRHTGHFIPQCRDGCMAEHVGRQQFGGTPKMQAFCVTSSATAVRTDGTFCLPGDTLLKHRDDCNNAPILL
jgi:hypothetical protein